METIRHTQKKYCSRAITLAIIVAVICLFIGQKAIGKGLVLGTAFSILNFVLIGETLPYKLNRSKRNTFFVSVGSIFFRYIILAVPLYVSLKLDEFNFFAAVLGIFSVQIVLLFDHLLTFLTAVRQKNT